MIFECSAFEDLRCSVEGARALINHSAGSVFRFMQGDKVVVREYTSACMDRVYSGEAVSTSDVLLLLGHAYTQTAWGGVEQDTDVREYLRNNQGNPGSNSKHVTYFCWFEQNSWPEYLSDLPNARTRAMMKQVARFRLSAHRLQVELGRRYEVIWEHRVCTRCEGGGHGRHVDDEQHLIFGWHSFEHLRSSVEGARLLIDSSEGVCVCSCWVTWGFVRDYLHLCLHG